jgi:hypothetical protein
MKTALFMFIVDRSSFIELKNAGRRSQFAGRLGFRCRCAATNSE